MSLSLASGALRAVVMRLDEVVVLYDGVGSWALCRSL